jgi:hypothetical protein
MSSLRGNVYNLITDQGSTVHQVFTIKNSARKILDLTGYTARMQIRVLNPITRNTTDLLIAEYTTEDGDGSLTVNGPAGTVTLLIPPTEMAGITPDTYAYDVEVESEDAGDTTKIIQGRFIVRAEVTR